MRAALGDAGPCGRADALAPERKRRAVHGGQAGIDERAEDQRAELRRRFARLGKPEPAEGRVRGALGDAEFVSLEMAEGAAAVDEDRASTRRSQLLRSRREHALVERLEFVLSCDGGAAEFDDDGGFRRCE